MHGLLPHRYRVDDGMRGWIDKRAGLVTRIRPIHPGAGRVHRHAPQANHRRSRDPWYGSRHRMGGRVDHRDGHVEGIVDVGERGRMGYSIRVDQRMSLPLGGVQSSS
jgi:hypothetical protein